MFSNLNPGPAEANAIVRFVRIVAVTVGAVMVMLGGVLLAAPTASANPHEGGIIEYYQYCYDRTPAQKLTSKTGTSPKHYYKTAIDRKNGIDCVYMYPGFGGFFPKEKTVYHSYTQVCKDIGFSSGKWYRSATGIAICR